MEHVETRKANAGSATASGIPVPEADLDAIVTEFLETTRVIDIHTHLFGPSFGPMGLSGIDALLTYHYLEAELFRFASIRPEDYWSLPEKGRADLVWQTLFVDNPPISAATRGVVSVLDALNLDPTVPTLEPLRESFKLDNAGAYLSRVFELAGVSDVVSTLVRSDRYAMVDRKAIDPGNDFAILRIEDVDAPVSGIGLNDSNLRQGGGHRRQGQQSHHQCQAIR